MKPMTSNFWDIASKWSEVSSYLKLAGCCFRTLKCLLVRGMVSPGRNPGGESKSCADAMSLSQHHP